MNDSENACIIAFRIFHLDREDSIAGTNHHYESSFSQLTIGPLSRQYLKGRRSLARRSLITPLKARYTFEGADNMHDESGQQIMLSKRWLASSGRLRNC